MVWHFTPYRERDLGTAYNMCLDMIPDDDAACLRDMDTMFLTPNAGRMIQAYSEQHPTSVLVCQTNRTHHLAAEQQGPDHLFENTDIKKHITHSNDVELIRGVTECTGPLSGFLMVVPKSVWLMVKFKQGILGVDTAFFKMCRDAGVKILRMNGLYIWHTYRLKNGVEDKSHLL